MQVCKLFENNSWRHLEVWGGDINIFNSKKFSSSTYKVRLGCCLHHWNLGEEENACNHF
jgi:hypothetical protein